MEPLTQDQLNQIFITIKDKLQIKVKIGRDEDWLEIKVELHLDDKIISQSEECVRVK